MFFHFRPRALARRGSAGSPSTRPSTRCSSRPARKSRRRRVQQQFEFKEQIKEKKKSRRRSSTPGARGGTSTSATPRALWSFRRRAQRTEKLWKGRRDFISSSRSIARCVLTVFTSLQSQRGLKRGRAPPPRRRPPRARCRPLPRSDADNLRLASQSGSWTQGPTNT